MSRKTPTPESYSSRFPRIRGNVPVSKSILPLETMFSPHTRGCPTFCLLLASRGAVYSRDTVLLTEAGKKYHDNCKCLGIEVQTPAYLPRINQELEQIYSGSGKYPGSDQEAFAEAIEHHRNQTPDWVPKDTKRINLLPPNKGKPVKESSHLMKH